MERLRRIDKAIESRFDKASDHVEWWFSQWYGYLSYCVACGLAILWWGWDGIDRYVYISTALLVLLGMNGNRRSMLALHAKVDKVTPDNTLNRIEERAEREIQDARDD